MVQVFSLFAFISREIVEFEMDTVIVILVVVLRAAVLALITVAFNFLLVFFLQDGFKSILAKIKSSLNSLSKAIETNVLIPIAESLWYWLPALSRGVIESRLQWKLASVVASVLLSLLPMKNLYIKHLQVSFESRYVATQLDQPLDFNRLIKPNIDNEFYRSWEQSCIYTVQVSEDFYSERDIKPVFGKVDLLMLSIFDYDVTSQNSRD